MKNFFLWRFLLFSIDEAFEQAKKLYHNPFKTVEGDRGYRGQKQSGDSLVMIPDAPKAEDTQYRKTQNSKKLRKRAAIEPVIEHLKSDHRLSRNSYWGLGGGPINIMLATAAYNFKRAIRVLFCAILQILHSLQLPLSGNISLMGASGSYLPAMAQESKILTMGTGEVNCLRGSF